VLRSQHELCFVVPAAVSECTASTAAEGPAAFFQASHDAATAALRTHIPAHTAQNNRILVSALLRGALRGYTNKPFIATEEQKASNCISEISSTHNQLVSSNGSTPESIPTKVSNTTA
jgi:hypothetical protein